MSVKDVLKMGSSQLLKKSAAITQFSCAELYELIEDMTHTMHETGGAGIAAPQIACDKRVIIFGFEKNLRYPNEQPIPFTVLINPEIEILTHETVDGWESCLSVPGLRGLVPRYQQIRYSGFDAEGRSIERSAEGFHARLVQHECDHIDGILFPQRIKDLRNFGFEEVILDKILRQPNFSLI